ncbi:MAG: hypothetical protein WCQ49_00225 [Candidatus Saccharibacteria bacterium]
MREKIEYGSDELMLNYPEIISIWERRGLDGSFGIIGTSIWRLENIINEGIRSHQSLNIYFDHLDYKNKNNIVFAPVSFGAKSIELASGYGELKSASDYIFNYLLKSGLSKGIANQFLLEDFCENLVGPKEQILDKDFYDESCWASDWLNGYIVLDQSEVQGMFKSAVRTKGILIGLRQSVVGNYLVHESKEDPRSELVIDLGYKKSLSADFIQGIMIPEDLTEPEILELERIFAKSCSI